MVRHRGRRLHHLAIGTADVERLAAFYREVFGLEERARFLDDSGGLRSVWLGVSGGVLMFERTHEPTRRVTERAAGPFLIAFEVREDERADLERVLARAGAGIEGRTEFTSYARDPDGNRVAISHYPLELDAKSDPGECPA